MASTGAEQEADIGFVLNQAEHGHQVIMTARSCWLKIAFGEDKKLA